MIALAQERLQEILDEPWAPVSGAALAGVLVFAALVLWLANTGDRWVWILDSANLAFHEAGHPLAGLFSARLMVYGGTIGQLVFPCLAAAAFWTRRHPASFASALVWLADNLFNIATYLGDARALQLPLVGGLDPQDAHDWHEILSRWGLLRWDTTLALALRLATGLLVLATCAWLAWRRASREDTR
jgi:hypothetical protein